MKKIHYAGAVRTPRMRVLPGWAACCSGERAERIRDNRRNTLDIPNVTCRACVRVMEKDPKLSQQLKRLRKYDD